MICSMLDAYGKLSWKEITSYTFCRTRNLSFSRKSTASKKKSENLLEMSSAALERRSGLIRAARVIWMTLKTFCASLTEMTLVRCKKKQYKWQTREPKNFNLHILMQQMRV